MSEAVDPNDVLYVWRCLQGSLSHVDEERRQAEAGLTERAKSENYCSCIVEILGHKEVDESAQWLAAVQLKNFVSRHWAPRHARDASTSTLTDREKQHLRAKMMGLLSLTNNKLSIQVAIVFAKIARHDYPAVWPTLFDDLVGSIQNQETDSLLTRSTLLVLHHILKELASKRLMADQKRFEDISQRLVDFIWSLWVAGAQEIVSLLPAGLATSRGEEAVQLEKHLAKWMLSTKILRRILVSGYGKDRETLDPVPKVCECLTPILQVLQALVNHRPSVPTGGYKCHVMLDVALLKLFKVTNTMIDVHPWAIHASGALMGCLQTYAVIITAPSRSGSSWLKIVGRAMTFVSLVTQSPSYNGRKQLVSLKPKQGVSQADLATLLGVKSQEVTSQLSAFWAENKRREQLINSLLTQHMPLSAADLDDWEDDPEAWYHAHEGIASEEEAQGITEILFLALLQHNQETLCPMISNGISAAWQSVTPAVLANPTLDSATQQALSSKEAMYHAACCAAYEMYDFVQFKDWLEKALLPELAVVTEHNKALQRRILRILAEWIASIKVEDRTKVYTAIMTLLTGPQAGDKVDLCLHLVAVDTLRVMVQDWDFNEEQFMPFLHPLLTHLPRLLQSCTSFDSHTLIFVLVSSIVERMGDLVVPHATAILSWLPDVWQNSEGQGLLRMQVITLLQRLVNALNTASPGMYPLLAPVLEYSLDAQGADALNLLEDALFLWLVALRNSPTGTVDLIHLWPRWTQIMTASIEHVEVCMHIATSCILLGGTNFLQVHGHLFAETLAQVIGDVNQKGMLAVYGPIQLLLLLYGDEACRLLQKPLLKLLHLLVTGEEESRSWSKGVTVMARVILHCPNACIELFDTAAKEGIHVARASPASGTTHTAPQSGAALFTDYLAIWLESFDTIANAVDRKLCALALAKIVTWPVPSILDKLDLIVPAITSVWYLAEGGGDAQSAAYAFDVYGSGQEADDTGAWLIAVSASEDAEGETGRRRQHNESDPVRTLKVSGWTKAQFAQAEQVHGQALNEAVNALGGAMSDSLQAMWA